MVFTFVGNFEIDSIMPLIEKYISSLPSSGQKNYFKDNGIGLPKTAVREIIKKAGSLGQRLNLYSRGI